MAAICAIVVMLTVIPLVSGAVQSRRSGHLETKIVFKKMERLEARSKFRWMTGDWQPKTETYYYAVAEDGTACELGIGEYAVAKEGKPLACPWAVLQ